MKNTIMISEDLINAVDQITGRKDAIEKLIEKLLRKYIAEEMKKQKDIKDLQILNENSEYLNSEAADVLDFQVNI